MANTEDAYGWRTDGEDDTRGRDSKARGRSISRHRNEYWAVEPDVGRVADGIPKRVDRLRALGNAVVPQVAEVIGRMIPV